MSEWLQAVSNVAVLIVALVAIAGWRRNRARRADDRRRLLDAKTRDDVRRKARAAL